MESALHSKRESRQRQPSYLTKPSNVADREGRKPWDPPRFSCKEALVSLALAPYSAEIPAYLNSAALNTISTSKVNAVYIQGDGKET
jgi:hypothetical protein